MELGVFTGGKRALFTSINHTLELKHIIRDVLIYTDVENISRTNEYKIKITSVDKETIWKLLVALIQI